MQQVNDLWEQLTSFENLYRAAYRVLQGKRNQVRAGDFFFTFEHNRCAYKVNYVRKPTVLVPIEPSGLRHRSGA